MPFHDRPPLSFTGKITNWFRDTYPNSSVRVQNAGVGGVTSTYYAQCVDMFVPDEDVDLVFVDFTLNDRASGIMGKSPEPDTPDRYGALHVPTRPSDALNFACQQPCFCWDLNIT